MAGLQCSPAAFSGQELHEGRSELVSDHLVIHDVDAIKERLVELAPGVVRCLSVELVGIREQVEVSLDERQGSAEVLLDSPELNGELVAGPRNLVQLHFDTRGREFAVCSEVDEVFFLHAQLAKLGFELLTEELLRPGLVGHGLFEARPYRGDELLAEAD